MLEITNELPETRVTLEVDSKNRAKIKTDTGDYDLMAKPPEEFPQPLVQETQSDITVPGKDLKDIINATSFAVSRDELKPALTGVLFKFTKDGLTAVSTDGHRLVRHKRKNFVSKNFQGEVIVPKKFLNYMSSYLNQDDVLLSISESHLSAKIMKDVVSTRIIGEKFPDYESVIPKENNKTLKSEKDVLIARADLSPSATISLSSTKTDDFSSSYDESDKEIAKATISWPIFKGGKNAASLNKSKNLKNRKKLLLDNATRMNNTNVATAWSSLQSSKSLLNSVILQVRAAEIANEGITVEYESGLGRSTLDVIQSNSLLLSSKISLAESERNYLLSQFRLLQAVGNLSNDYLKLQ